MVLIQIPLRALRALFTHRRFVLRVAIPLYLFGLGLITELFRDFAAGKA